MMIENARLTRLARLGVCALALTAMSACAARDRASYIGQPPPLSPIAADAALRGVGISEQGQAASQRQLEALQAAIAARQNDSGNLNSLWRSNSSTFFGDPRAARVGDILTVNINIADRAQVNNQTNRARVTSESAGIPNFFGGEAALDGFFNDAIDPANLVRMGSTSSTRGSGSVNRSETIRLTAAAIVVDVLWNGNMVVHGRQEVRINNEVRELLISGIVRPQDIASDNTIDHAKIAEARISYGGRGHISEMQRPPVGQEIYNLLWPF
jgi:flagellar L-ring protein precursor FlgH